MTPRSKLKTQLSKVGGPRRRSREKQKGRREERDRDRSIKQGDVGSTDRSQTILHWEKHRDARRREETTYTQWDPRRAESKSGELIVARAADEAATIRKPDLWAARVYIVCVSTRSFSSLPPISFLLSFSLSCAFFPFHFFHSLPSLRLIVFGVQQGDLCTGYARSRWLRLTMETSLKILQNKRISVREIKKRGNKKQ